MFFQKELETLSRQKIRQLQLERLKFTIDRLGLLNQNQLRGHWEKQKE